MPANILRIGTADHVYAPPLSMTECAEIQTYALEDMRRAQPGLRGAAVLLCACFPTLKPPGLPAWTGENGAVVGRLCSDHLMAFHRQSPGWIFKAVRELELLRRICENLPSEQEVEEAVKNS